MALHGLDDSGRELLTFSFSPLPTPYLRHQTPPLTPSCCSSFLEALAELSTDSSFTICAVGKTNKFWRATWQSNVADKREGIGQSAVTSWVRKPNLRSFCFSQPFLYQVWLFSGPPEFCIFRYCAWLRNWFMWCLFNKRRVCNEGREERISTWPISLSVSLS